MHVKLHSQGIKGSRTVEEGEEPDALFGVVIEIEGHLFPRVHKVNLSFGDDFAKVTAEMNPSSIEIVSHTKDTWAELQGRMKE